MNQLTIFSCFLQFSLYSSLQTFLETPIYSEVNPSETVILSCVVANKGGECMWEKDGTPVGMYQDKYEWAGAVDEGDCSLAILDALSEYDAGMWQCQVSASNIEQGDSLISHEAEIVVRAAPKELSIQSDDGTVIAPKSIIKGIARSILDIQCVSTGGKPAPMLAFTIDDLVIPTEKQRNIRLPNGDWVSSLNFPGLVQQDWNESTIKCIASHKMSFEKIETMVQIEVFYIPEIREVTIEQTEVKEGGTVTIHCDVDSHPPSRISWMKKGQDELILSTGPDLILNSIDYSMQGVYQCSAENKVGKSEVKTVELSFNYAPVIQSVGPSQEIIAVGGNSVKLTCSAEATPAPNYRWLQQTLSGELLERGRDKALVIERVNYKDSGDYYCEASNVVSRETREILSVPINVEVRGVPQIVTETREEKKNINGGENVQFDITFCSNPMPYISWRTEQGELLPENSRRKFIVQEEELKESLCYVASMQISNVEASDTGIYVLYLENELGVTTEDISLIIDDGFFTMEIIIAISSGSIMTIIIFIFLLFTICKSRMPKRDMESRNSGSISDTDSRDNSSDDLIYKRTDVKKGILKCKIFQPVVTDFREANLSDLYNFPKSSNCGSMRIKKANEAADLQSSFNANNLIHVNTMTYSSYVSYDDIDQQISDIL